ncbi:phage portal protein [Limnoglobus roseus]|uniref:phage portal protein n=1 Tax=Limnoglobus roseus TaxID=2598579 RepID=UPI00143CEDBC|nr:phage portal protein [Limnoglobus roseus]
MSADAVRTREIALTIPAVSAAVGLYKRQIASFPLLTYTATSKDGLEGRTKAEDIPEFRLLNAQPNENTPRQVLMKGLVDDYWWHGEAFLLVRYDGTGKIFDLARLPASSVYLVTINEVTGKKEFRTRTGSYERTYPALNEKIIHIIREPDDYGLRGVDLLTSAGEVLGLHRQIMTSAEAYYRNSVRPSGYISIDGTGRLQDNALELMRSFFKAMFGGSQNVGEIPVLQGAKFNQLTGLTAQDAAILEALAASAASVCMVFELVPSDIGDQSQSKYNSVAADKSDQVTRSFRPVLDNFETAINNALWPNGEYWCEFDTDEILRGDPETFARVVGMGITSGYILRSEMRDWLGLPPEAGLDIPLYPLNQGPQMANQTTNDQGAQQEGNQANDNSTTGV